MKAGRLGLSEDDAKSILEALNVQLQKPGAREHLSHPVDEVRYSGCEKMVEVPMDIMIINRRLELDYYATKLSVFADVKLIRDMLGLRMVLVTRFPYVDKWTCAHVIEHSMGDRVYFL